MLAGLMMLTACGVNGRKKGPVTLTVWHVYGGQADSPLNDLIEEFNETVGAEEGIKLQVTVVSNTNNIHDAVLRAANDEPGTTGLPDMFISYPKTVLAMPDPEILVDYRDYFSDEELSAYIPAFLEEGEIDGRLVVFPWRNPQKSCSLIRPCLTGSQRIPELPWSSLIPGKGSLNCPKSIINGRMPKRRRCREMGKPFLSMTTISIISR